MRIDIRLPNITATNDAGKLSQMQSYMYQLVEQLNWALNAIETVGATGTATPTVKVQQSESLSQEEALVTFNSIKALIIKSADIVNAYEETIRTNFKGEYFAESDFGTFVQTTSRYVEENSRGVTEAYESIEKIDTDVFDLKDYVDTTKGYIQRGILSDGSIGIEVGETTDDGTFKHYARFTSDKLSFYDVNGNVVAYIGAGSADEANHNCLYIRGKAIFQSDIQFGGYYADTSDGLAFTWIGG